MWVSSPVVLDEVVKILVFELEDVGAIVGVWLIANLWWDGILLPMGAGALTGAGLYYLKRGKPAGALVHLVHRLQLTLLVGLPGLPGLMRPYRRRFYPN